MSSTGGEFVIVLDATVPSWSSVLVVFESNCGLTSVMQISQAGRLPPVHYVGAWLLGKGKTPHHSVVCRLESPPPVSGAVTGTVSWIRAC